MNILHISSRDNPAPFTEPIKFTITLEYMRDDPAGEGLCYICADDDDDEEIEFDWKVIYVGSSENVKYDQVLDSFSIELSEKGIMEFDLEVT